MAERKEKCPNCGKWYVDLNSHKICHGRRDSVAKIKEEYKAQCPKCGKWYVDLDSHKVCHGRKVSAVKRKDENKVQCPQCEKWYVNLKNHNVCHGRKDSAVKRKDEDKVQCPQCEKWYVNLENHKVCRGRKDSAVKRMDEDKVQCPQCEKWYVNLENHKVCHGRKCPSASSKDKATDGRKQQCPNCRKWYVNLENHSVCHRRCRESVNAVEEEQTCAVMKLTQSSQVVSSHTLTEPKCSPSRVSHSSTGRSYASMDTYTVDKMEEFVHIMIDNQVIHYSGNPRTDISKFFKEEVQLRKEEIETAAKHFKMLQQSVVEFLVFKTPWNWKAFRAGSHYDGTKVSRPNEMDCVLIPDLTDDIKPVYDGCVAGFCRAKVMTLSQDIKHICDGHFINKSKYRQFIFSIMDQFVKENRKGRTRCKTNLTHASSPSYGLIYDGVSTDYGPLHIDVDFVPVLHVPSWPPLSVARDLRKLPKNISAKIDGEDIMAEGVNLVTRQCPGSPADQDLQWKVSCSNAEKKLTFYGEKSCWKPVLRTMKRVVEIAKGIEVLTITGKSLEIQNAAQYTRDHYLRQRDFRLSFYTYYIRSLMWYLLYDLTAGNHVWKEESQENRLKFSLNKLRMMITGELVVPHFFIPGIRDIMTIRPKDREFMWILVRATEIIFSRSRER